MDEETMQVFDIYFASIASMALHPGFNRDNCEKLSLQECAEIAQEMLKIREQILCLGHQQQ